MIVIVLPVPELLPLGSRAVAVKVLDPSTSERQFQKFTITNDPNSSTVLLPQTDEPFLDREILVPASPLPVRLLSVLPLVVHEGVVSVGAIGGIVSTILTVRVVDPTTPRLLVYWYSIG